MLPDEMGGFKSYAGYISERASDPDEWKNFLPEEKFKHYINIDHYDSYPFKDVPREYNAIKNTANTR